MHRSLYGLDAVNFLIAAMQTCFGAFVTVHLVRNGWVAEEIGFALTIGTMSNLVCQVPGGFFVDGIRDKRRAIWLGTLGLAAAALLLGLSPGRSAVCFGLALQGFASSLLGPGIASTTLAVVGQPLFSERIGRNARFASIGNGLTAAVMGFAGSWFDPTVIFTISAALSVPALFALSLIGRSRGSIAIAGPVGAGGQGQDNPKLTWDGVKSLFLSPGLLVFAACVLLFFASSGALLPGVAGHVTRQRPEFATLIVAVTILLPQVIVASMSPWVGRTADRAGRRPLLLLGWGCFRCKRCCTQRSRFRWRW